MAPIMWFNWSSRTQGTPDLTFQCWGSPRRRQSIRCVCVLALGLLSQRLYLVQCRCCLYTIGPKVGITYMLGASWYDGDEQGMLRLLGHALGLFAPIGVY